MKKLLLGMLILLNVVALTVVGILIYMLMSNSNGESATSGQAAEQRELDEIDETLAAEEVFEQSDVPNTSEEVEACFDRLKAEYEEKVAEIERETENALLDAMLEENVQTNDERYYDIKIEGINRKQELIEQYRALGDTCMPN